MTYANQNQIDGLELLPYEDPALIFLEKDRKAAYKDITNLTDRSADRMRELSEAGSHQAEFLLHKILNGDAPRAIIAAGGLVVNYDEMVAHMWVYQDTGQLRIANNIAASIGLTPDCLTPDSL